MSCRRALELLNLLFTHLLGDKAEMFLIIIIIEGNNRPNGDISIDNLPVTGTPCKVKKATFLVVFFH